MRGPSSHLTWNDPDVSDPFELCKPSTSKINELRLSITIYLGLCVKFYTIKLMFRIRSMCDYRRHVSNIIIKDTRGSLIMYFNYTLFKLYVYANIFFIAQLSLVLGKGPVSFWGGQSVFKSTGPPGHCIHKPNVKACALLCQCFDGRKW